MIHSLSSLLDLPPHDGKSRASDWRWEDGFWLAWKALEQSHSPESGALVQQGLTKAIHLQEVIFRQATYLFSTRKAIQSAGSFRYVKLVEGVESIFLARPLTLAKLGFFLFECGVVQQNVAKPLVLCSPIPGRGSYLVVAITGTMLTPGVSTKK